MRKFLDDNNDKEKEPVFTKEDFREKLTVWITIDDQPFTVMLAITADNVANNNTFLKEFETECSAGEVQDENDILKEISEKSVDLSCNLYSNINFPNLLLDVKTRWNLTYLILERALTLQEPLDDITGLDRNLNAFAILKKEWSTIKELCRVLKVNINLLII
ncbi:hypothetical protein C1646_774466 [Rhizophagus diaphanus]|nr:hypothetical protein C1646_774466 [Rhizophagus diaphanus] [Rhizophagus sp. MUCL 43196]